MSKIDAKVKARFFAKVSVSDGCWNWIGARRRYNGYGVFIIGGVAYGAHRVMFAIENPEHEETMLRKSRAVGMRFDYILHSCDNPSCVNPAHLRMGCASDNAQDKARRGRGVRGLPPVAKGMRRGSGANPIPR